MVPIYAKRPWLLRRMLMSELVVAGQREAAKERRVTSVGLAADELDSTQRSVARHDGRISGRDILVEIK